jgi:hypothetical protein
LTGQTGGADRATLLRANPTRASRSTCASTSLANRCRSAEE